MSNSKCVYYKEKEQKSFDGGITWQDTGNFRKGAIISTQASQCGSYTNEYRWIKADYVCYNGNKYNGYKQQVSYDNGGSWVDTGVVDIGDLIETNSKDCAGDTGTTTGSTTGGTLSMKVTYTDGTEKKFYNLDEIYSDTDQNKYNAKDVEIYDGVTAIGWRAFANCSSLTSITIPNSVIYISDAAFRGCSSLSSITIPNSVTSIGDTYVFGDCSSLSSITIGNSVASIGSAAFYKCSSLTSITIPNSVTIIGGNAFYNCSGLTSITLSDRLRSIEGGTFKLCEKLTGITIPNSVTSIGENAFNFCSSLTSITLPNSVTRIGGYAFSNCSSLTSITFPNSVTSIGTYAFNGCTSLTSITVNAVTPPKIGTEIIADSGIQAIYVPAASLDAYKSADRWNEYADKILPIGASMKVTYTDGSTKYFTGLTSIERDTDSNKVNAKDVVIYDSVTSIGDHGFRYCSSLSSIIIPDSVTSIGYYAFQNCSSLSSITIPNSVTSIGESAFQSCSSLTSITLPLGIELISGRLFYNCENLESVTLPASVKSIGDNAFDGCSSLTGITIPNSVTSIGNYAFDGCSSLSSLTIDETEVSNSELTSIGSYAFRGTNLTSLTLPASLTSIGIAAFANCGSLSSITIPNSVISIGNYAFYGCSGLTSMTVNATIPPSLGDKAIPSNIQRIYVPADSLDAYKAADGWKDYADKIWVIGYDEKWFVLTGDKDFICDEGSKYKKKEMKYTRDSGTTWNSFNPPKYEKGDLIAQTSTDCSKMKVTYTDNTEKTFTGLASIEKDTVPNKPNVKNVEIYNGVTSIGNSAFSGCTSLTSVTIPDSVEIIDDFSFNSCSHITEITIPSSVDWIGNAAFDYCSNLKSVTIQNSTTRLQLNNNTFSNISSDRSLFVPLRVLHLYKDDGNWSIAFNGNIYPIS